RCPDDLSIRQPDPGGDGVWNRTSYLLNSQLSHKTRRYGRWTLLRLVNEPGTSNFIAYVERNATGILASGGDPKQDDFDIWLRRRGMWPRPAWQSITLFLLACGTLAGLSGCPRAEPRVVLYCSQDREFAVGLLEQFHRQFRLAVVPKFDTEASKSVSLYNEI